MANPTPSTHITPEQAAAIMGDNFHDLDAQERQFRIRFSSKVHEIFSTVPFSSEVLQACAETHVLIACASFSLMDLYQYCLFSSKSVQFCSWWRSGMTPRVRVKSGWQLVRKYPVTGSANKTWVEQNQLLGADELVPSASVLAQAILIHRWETGEWILREIECRTSDVAYPGCHVVVGYFDMEGLVTNRRAWDEGHHEHRFLASAKKPS